MEGGSGCSGSNSGQLQRKAVSDGGGRPKRKVIFMRRVRVLVPRDVNDWQRETEAKPNGTAAPSDEVEYLHLYKREP